VYIDYYGGAVVELQELIREEGQWRVYRCIDGDGALDIMIAAEENKCEKEQVRISKYFSCFNALAFD
jgi:hypothetical protein